MRSDLWGGNFFGVNPTSVFFLENSPTMQIFAIGFEGGQSELGMWYPVHFEHRLLGGLGGGSSPQKILNIKICMQINY